MISDKVLKLNGGTQGRDRFFWKGGRSSYLVVNWYTFPCMRMAFIFHLTGV